MSTNDESVLRDATFEEAAAFVAGKVAPDLSDDEVAELCVACLLKLPDVIERLGKKRLRAVLLLGVGEDDHFEVAAAGYVDEAVHVAMELLSHGAQA